MNPSSRDLEFLSGEYFVYYKHSTIKKLEIKFKNFLKGVNTVIAII
jgi:hypothetical protein